MRYQLLKTSTYLGGQIRWDIPLQYHYDASQDGSHIIDTPELHIVPLNDDIIFNEDNSRETFNYSHLENIKHLYDLIGSNMFSAAGEWSGEYWLYNNGDILDPYSHIYNMGARRTRFTRYNKQFSYLCPLWISEETDPSKFSFEVSVRIREEERDHIVRREFHLSDAICNYMKEYLDKSDRYIKQDPAAPDPGYQGVNDNLLSIKFDPDYAFITGVNVKTGCYSTLDISYMIPNLIFREVPMIEFDNMLVSKFRESNIIAQQLINLNFLFNIDDISYILKEQLLGKDVTVTLLTKYDNKYLELKDFYTNYTDIPVYRMDRSSLSNTKNVCDYIGDDLIVDYMYTNKFTQPIFHWTMVENPTYIYNFYDGFAPVFKDKDEFIRVKGKYYDQADISQENHTVYNSASNWCKMYDLSGLTARTAMEYNTRAVRNPDMYTSQLFMNFDTGISYLNNNRYDIVKMSNIPDSIKNMQPVYIYSTIKDPGHICASDTDVAPAINASLIIDYSQDRIILRFECDSIYHSTYRRYKEYLKYMLANNIDLYTDSDGRKFAIRMIDGSTPTLGNVMDLLQFIVNMYDCWIPPYRVEFNRGILTDTVDGFDDNYPKECVMLKYNVHDGYVLRYTGALCPLFIDPTDEYYRNINYRYKQWGNITDAAVRKYSDMLKTGMTPLYPSIGYYSFENEYDSQQRPQWYDDNWPWEVSWKNDGVSYVLPEQYKATTEPRPAAEYNEDVEEMVMWPLLYEYISSLGILIDTPWKKHKIKELYNITFNFDYASETDVENMVYYVKFHLK